MRNLLLAAAALTVVGVGSALAAGGPLPVNISATLAESCSLTQPSDIGLTGTTAGTSGVSNFSVTCNFGGTGLTPMTVTFESDNGGVKSGANVVDYTIAFESTSGLASAAALAPLVAPSSSAGANVATPKSFTATLASDITIAGTYTDVVHVSVAP